MTDANVTLDRLEVPLVDAGLSPIDLPDHLRQPVPDDREGLIVSRAYEGRATRLARITRLDVPSFRGLNAIVFPDVDRPAPILGVDLSERDDDVTTFVVDLWGMEHTTSESTWDDVRAPFDRAPIDWTPGTALEGPKARLLSEAGLWARDEDGLCSLESALDAITEALDVMSRGLESLESRPDCHTTASQEKFCRMHTAKPGGRDALVEWIGESRVDEYLERLFFPAPRDVD